MTTTDTMITPLGATVESLNIFTEIDLDFQSRLLNFLYDNCGPLRNNFGAMLYNLDFVDTHSSPSEVRLMINHSALGLFRAYALAMDVPNVTLEQIEQDILAQFIHQFSYHGNTLEGAFVCSVLREAPADMHDETAKCLWEMTPGRPHDMENRPQLMDLARDCGSIALRDAALEWASQMSAKRDQTVPRAPR